jgi:hypothetical protein
MSAENKRKHTFVFLMPQDKAEQFQTMCDLAGRSQSEVLRGLVEGFMEDFRMDEEMKGQLRERMEAMKELLGDEAST